MSHTYQGGMTVAKNNASGLQMTKATYRLRSLSPMLQHSTAGMSETSEAELRTKGDNLTGQDEAEMGCYRNADGHLVFPTLWIRGALWGAASGRKIGKLTARRTLSGVVLIDEFITLFDPSTGAAIDEYEIDTRFVKVGSARVPRSRAKISEWVAEFALEYDPDFISAGAIEELLNLAGRMIGIGDYRPSTGGGPFGRFTAELIE